jgi:predicted PurR-regulated permease PerM
MKKIITASVVIATLLCVAYYPVVTSFLNATPQSPSEFGEMFGGLNAILSYLALLAVVTGLYLQSRELATTSQELAKSSTAQQESSESLRKQLVLMSLQTEAQILEIAKRNDVERIENYTTWDAIKYKRAIDNCRWRIKEYSDQIEKIAESLKKAS